MLVKNTTYKSTLTPCNKTVASAKPYTSLSFGAVYSDKNKLSAIPSTNDFLKIRGISVPSKQPSFKGGLEENLRIPISDATRKLIPAACNVINGMEKGNGFIEFATGVTNEGKPFIVKRLAAGIFGMDKSGTVFKAEPRDNPEQAGLENFVVKAYNGYVNPACRQKDFAHEAWILSQIPPDMTHCQRLIARYSENGKFYLITTFMPGKPVDYETNPIKPGQIKSLFDNVVIRLDSDVKINDEDFSFSNVLTEGKEAHLVDLEFARQFEDPLNLCENFEKDDNKCANYILPMMSNDPTFKRECLDYYLTKNCQKDSKGMRETLKNYLMEKSDYHAKRADFIRGAANDNRPYLRGRVRDYYQHKINPAGFNFDISNDQAVDRIIEDGIKAEELKAKVYKNVPEEFVDLEALKDQITYSRFGTNKFKGDKPDIGAVTDLSMINDYIHFIKKGNEIKEKYHQSSDIVELANLELKSMGIFFKTRLVNTGIEGGINCFADEKVRREYYDVAYAGPIWQESAIQETLGKIKNGQHREVPVYNINIPDNLFIIPNFAEQIINAK